MPENHFVVLSAHDEEYGIMPDALLNFATMLGEADKLCAGRSLPRFGTLVNSDMDFRIELPCGLFTAYALLADALARTEVVERLGRDGLWTTMEQLNAIIYRSPSLTSFSSLRGFRDSDNGAGDDGTMYCTDSSGVGGSCSGSDISPPATPQPTPLPLVQRLVKHVNKAFRNANTFRSKLPLDALLMEGFSGTKTRHFYNSLCADAIEAGRKTRYLEVGTFQGSSLVSTLFGNSDTCRATVVETWHEYGGKKEFWENLLRFNVTNDVDVYEEDFFAFNVSQLQNEIDVYLYDGDHSVKAHHEGIVRVWSALAQQAIVIIDDWNGENVRNGTFSGLAAVGAHVEESWEIMYVVSGGHTPKIFAGGEFWNGIAVFVIDKTKTVMP